MHIEEAVRSADSALLLRELARRGVGTDPDATRRQSHVVGSLRPKNDESDARSTALDAALLALGEPGPLFEGPPLKAYNTFVRPRDRNAQTVENAAHQIAFLQRHERSRRATYMRNTDVARETRGDPNPITLILDNVRSAENVGSIYRTADCGRCANVVTCGLTPNPLSTAKIAKTAFGAEAGVESQHFESTLDACRHFKDQGWKLWALETVDGALPYTDAPHGDKVAVLLGNEVTGLNLDVLSLVDAVVEIPTYGTKNSMNVAVAAGVVTYDLLRRFGRH